MYDERQLEALVLMVAITNFFNRLNTTFRVRAGRARIDAGPSICRAVHVADRVTGSVDSLGLGLASAAQVAWRLVAVANGDRSDRELRRNAERRPVGIDPLDRNAEEKAPSPASTAVSIISSDANPVSISQ